MPEGLMAERVMTVVPVALVGRIVARGVKARRGIAMLVRLLVVIGKEGAVLVVTSAPQTGPCQGSGQASCCQEEYCST